MPSKSKNKGSSAERALAKILTEWSGDVWKRVPNSGALRWGGVGWEYGDLLPPEGYPLILESKHYESVDLDACLRLKAQPNNILGWWDQVTSDVQRCYQDTGKCLQPVLVYKANRKPRRVVIEQGLLQAISLHLGPVLIPHFTFVNGRESLIILDLEAFLGMVNPKLLCKVASIHRPSCLQEFSHADPRPKR